MRYLLGTNYKGSRLYIQGGDLFNEIVKQLHEIIDLKDFYVSQLAFSRFTYNLCELCVDEVCDPLLVVGKGVISHPSGSKKKFYLVETEQLPNGRYPFDEESLVEKAEYIDNSICLNQSLPYTSIETAIALTKALSYKLMPLDKDKWVFGRIDLNSTLPKINHSIKISQVSAVKGRFSVNTIEIDGEIVGKVQFITGNP